MSMTTLPPSAMSPLSSSRGSVVRVLAQVAGLLAAAVLVGMAMMLGA